MTQRHKDDPTRSVRRTYSFEPDVLDHMTELAGHLELKYSHLLTMLIEDAWDRHIEMQRRDAE